MYNHSLSRDSVSSHLSDESVCHASSECSYANLLADTFCLSNTNKYRIALDLTIHPTEGIIRKLRRLGRHSADEFMLDNKFQLEAVRG